VPKHPHFYPIILAGGRGTRFWPLSRKRRGKQLLALDGHRTMIQQTVARLLPIAPPRRFWIVSNHDLRSAIVRQLPKLNPKQIVAEPVGRNTAPAIGLAAFLLLRQDPDAVLGLFPSDHVIADPDRYRETLGRGIEVAAAGENIVVLGIRPTRPETGYGYIEAGAEDANGSLRVRTLATALREHLPNTAPLLEKIAAAYGTRQFADTFRKLYPKCGNISIDYAVLEPRSAKGEGQSRIFCLPSDFGWNDLGSWAALHEHHVAKAKPAHGNLIVASGNFALNASDNYIHAPGKFVAAIGVRNLVVVETDDALLITTLDQSQDVGKVVKHLDEKKLKKLT
jgi:mannose-1-phosphate guanylyltransferase